MSGRRTARADGKIPAWVCVVYLISFACYIPLLLERRGKTVPGGLLLLRYGFILVPAAVSFVFWLREGGLKAGLLRQCKRISRKEAGVCGVMALTGVAVTWGYSLVEGVGLFGDAYPSVLSFAGSCVYLFATALAEEAAWRGFLFRRMAAGGNRLAAAAVSGGLWALWHIPMWWIRNALAPAEIAALLLWALLLGMALSLFYSRFSNIVSSALLHMTCNVCWLAPTKYNVAALLAVMLLGWVFRKRARRM